MNERKMSVDEIEGICGDALLAVDACIDLLWTIEIMRLASPFTDEDDGTPKSWKSARDSFGRVFRNMANAAQCVEVINDDLAHGARDFFEQASVFHQVTYAPPDGRSLCIDWAQEAVTRCITAIHSGLSSSLDPGDRAIEVLLRAMPRAQRNGKFRTDLDCEAKTYWLEMAERIERQEGADIFNQILEDCWTELEFREMVGDAGRRWKAAKTGIERERTAAIVRARAGDTTGGSSTPRKQRDDTPSDSLKKKVIALKNGRTWWQVREVLHEKHKNLLPANKRDNADYPTDSTMMGWKRQPPASN